MAPKRTPEEWATVVRISGPAVKHLFLEGNSDARIIASLLGYPAPCDVRSGDEIDDDLADATPFFGGNKLRLIKVAAAVEPWACPNVVCLIDADFAPFVEWHKRLIALRATDFANLPVTTLTEEWLRSFLLRSFGYVMSVATWKEICVALVTGFVARYLSAQSDEPRGAPDLGGACQIKEGELTFDADAYLQKFFGVTGLALSRMRSATEELSAVLDGDVRYAAHSQDTLDLVYFILKSSGRLTGSFPRASMKPMYIAAFQPEEGDRSVLSELNRWATS